MDLASEAEVVEEQVGEQVLQAAEEEGLQVAGKELVLQVAAEEDLQEAAVEEEDLQEAAVVASQEAVVVEEEAVVAEPSKMAISLSQSCEQIRRPALEQHTRAQLLNFLLSSSLLQFTMHVRRAL